MISGRLAVRVIYNHFPKISSDIAANAALIVAKAAHDIAAGTQSNIAGHGLIDTGAMFNSVKAEPLGKLVWRVVVGAEYGVYHEFGTRFLPARPFLGPAADLVRPQFRAAMAGVVRR